jgi:ribosomal protein L22
MADEKKSGARASSGTGSKKDDAEKKPAAKKPAARKTAAKKTADKQPAEKKPRAGATAKSEDKPARKTAARKTAPRKTAARKTAAKKTAEQPAPAAKAEAPAKAEAAKPKPAAGERQAPARPVVHARAKYVRSSARKARLVMDHVRGRSVADARALLQHSPRGVARDVARLLDSAVANAENNHDLVGDDLFVMEIYADEGPTLRRFRPRAQGRATRIRKRTSHLTVGLSTKE